MWTICVFYLFITLSLSLIGAVTGVGKTVQWTSNMAVYTVLLNIVEAAVVTYLWVRSDFYFSTPAVLLLWISEIYFLFYSIAKIDHKIEMTHRRAMFSVLLTTTFMVLAGLIAFG